jgi:alpha-1,3-rhamnosyl/mannosyltransferase
MLVAVDARQAYRANRRGIGRSLVHLVRALAAARPGWRFRLFHEDPPADDPFAGLPNVTRRQIGIVGAYWFNLWERVRLPAAASGADVLFCPANTGPGFAFTPMLLTVHDVIPLDTDPDSAFARDWAKRVRRAARAARLVYTPSDYSRGRIVERFGIRPEKVVAVPSAADPDFAPVTEPGAADRVRAKYGLAPGRRFVFGFAAEDPRKNTRRVLEAWARLTAALRERFDLVLVGIQESALPTFRSIAQGLLPGGGWHLHGFAPDEDVPVLLAAADVLCFPSLSEGFGLPVLDAFRVGTAVLTSNVTSLPELTGDAAVLVDPRDADAISSGLAALLGDDACRAEFAARGRERERQFTWERTAERVAALLAAVAR